MNKKKLKLFGLTGGIASGKSVCSDFFKDLGAIIIDADKIARNLVKPGTPHYKKIVKYFGNEILTKTKKNSPINRKKLGHLVFGNKFKLEKLNSILEKKIVSTAFDLYKHQSSLKKNMNKIFIYDAATIFESGAFKLLNKIIIVYIPQALQLKRLVKRNKFTSSNARKILKSQLPINKKRKMADFVIDNSKGFKYTERQVMEIYKILKQSF